MLGRILTAGFTDPAVILGLGFGPLHGTTNNTHINVLRFHGRYGDFRL